ncbi:pumilo [Meira miltonrushii]|uniref:Pumilio homology domain family member 3 n=1 Tax=Meira miltonrushii TaxID=1280837 RepID=A0A316V6J3_9BASI|nr:pumilo [Meira miltonrushii]PWN32111.1 pumilo [Meira miltonrushii]
MPENNVQRSPLLEEFRTRQNRGRKFELHDVLGSVVEFSSDQHGSRFIQEKLTSASDEDLQLIFDEIYPKANALMTDVFGNYVIQKLIENGTDEMRSKLVESMRNQIHSLSLSTYGCRVVQRALDYVEPEERLNIADELRDQIIPCVRDQNANHVIQKILERVSPTSQIDYIPQAFRGNVYSLAAHCYSCRVLQRIFEFCDKAQSRPLLEELLEDADRLMRDQYGNYVIQWILSKAGRNEKDRIIRLAKGNILRLSKHKFASNVVESIIAAASEEDRYHFIEEIMLEKPIAAVVMMRDQYGNYVLQRFLELAEGQQKQKLVMLIKPVLNNLKRSSSGYTKHLVAIERLLDTTTTRNNAATMTNNPSHSNAGMSSYQ